VKSGFGRAFTDLCDRVTVDAATNQLRRGEIEDLYGAWMEGMGFVNKTNQSLQAQLSKLRVFWDFAHQFGARGIAFVQNWHDNNVPNVRLNMFPTELRTSLRRGYV
jgi:hypothetical protein